MCFLDKTTGKAYVEEVTGGSLSYIEEDELVEEITSWLREYGLLDMKGTDNASPLY